MGAPSLVWSVVASLTQPLWDGGRIGAGVEAAKSRRLQAELDSELFRALGGGWTMPPSSSS